MKRDMLIVTLVFANAARRDAGFFNVFYCVHTFCGLSGWGGGVMLMFLGSVT